MVGSGSSTPQRSFGGFQFGASSGSSPVASPDLSPRAGVIFKGLNKRDSTTKAKAAEELITYLASSDCQEEDGVGLISSWVAVYESLALDVDRRVRAAAHTITGSMVRKYGKKTAPYMKQDLAGLWLIGMNDSDRLVSKAAQASFNAAFPGTDKAKQFRVTFASSIWSKAEDLAFEETADSLSDARFTKPAEAEVKFENAASASLTVMAYLVRNNLIDDAAIRSLLNKSALWSLAINSPGLQRAVTDLLIASFGHVDTLSEAELQPCSQNLPKLLQKAELRNSCQMVSLLQAFRSASETGSLLADVSKKGIGQRTIQFIERITGPGLDDSYWSQLGRFLSSELHSIANVPEARSALRAAILKATKSASRLQAEDAALLAATVMNALPEEGDADRIGSTIGSLIHQGQLKRSESWFSILERGSSENVFNREKCIIQVTRELLEWQDPINDGMKRSIDAWLTQLKKSVRDEAWLNVDVLIKQLSSAADAAADRLASKPDPSLIILTKAIGALPELGKGSIAQKLEGALSQQGVDGIGLDLAALRSLHADDASIAGSYVRILSNMDDSDQRLAWLTKVADQESVIVIPLLASQIQNAAVPSTNEGFKIYSAAVLKFAKQESAFPAQFSQAVANTLVTGSQDEGRIDAVCALLLELDNFGCSEPIRLAMSSEPSLLDALLTQTASQSKDLLSRAGRVVGKSQLARSIRKKILCIHDAPAIQSIAQTIHWLDLSWSDLGVDEELDRSMSDTMPPRFPEEMLILTTMSPLRQFVEQSATRGTYDPQGYSQAARLGIVLSSFGSDFQDSQKVSFALLQELAKDCDLHPEANQLSQGAPDLSALRNVSISSHKDSRAVIERMIEQAQGRTARHFYAASLLYTELTRRAALDIRPEEVEECFERCAKGNDNLFAIYACSSALNHVLFKSQKATFTRNKLASDLTSAPDGLEALQKIWQFNALLPDESEGPLLPRQRAVFLVQALLKANNEDLHGLHARLTLLRRLFEELKTEYGSFWVTAVELLQQSLQKALHTSNIPLQFAASRMYDWLCSNCEANDDLSEAYQNGRHTLEGQIAALFIAVSKSPQTGMASTLLTLLVARLARSLPPPALQEAHVAEQIPSTLLSPFEHVQFAASSMLDTVVIKQREDMILTSSLAKEYEEVDIAVPAELLSIVLDTPVTDEDELDSLPEVLPTDLFGYLLAWKAIFGFFESIPLRMKINFVEDLAHHDVLEPLLALIFAVLKVDSPKPKDISKIDKLSLDHNFESSSGELQAFVAHLYSLCLMYAPNLVRSWWIACTDRVLTAKVEAFTEKYYSHLLIQSELASVQNDKIQKAIQDDNLEVRISNLGKDVIVGYTVDEQKMEMAIRLPANYPLRKVTVEGLQKIGVKDAQWRGWLLASQAVLTAHNGTILDAIVQFQKNVSLHFEGIEGCSICFSVLAVEDRSLPTKRCATCKHLFHGTCLYKWFKSSAQATCALCRSSFYSTD